MYTTPNRNNSCASIIEWDIICIIRGLYLTPFPVSLVECSSNIAYCAITCQSWMSHNNRVTENISCVNQAKPGSVVPASWWVMVQSLFIIFSVWETRGTWWPQFDQILNFSIQIFVSRFKDLSENYIREIKTTCQYSIVKNSRITFCSGNVLEYTP